MCLVNYAEMSRVTGVPFNYLLSKGQQIKVISQLYRKANSDDYVVPSMKGEGKASLSIKIKPIDSAFVHRDRRAIRRGDRHRTGPGLLRRTHRHPRFQLAVSLDHDGA